MPAPIILDGDARTAQLEKGLDDLEKRSTNPGISAGALRASGQKSPSDLLPRLPSNSPAGATAGPTNSAQPILDRIHDSFNKLFGFQPVERPSYVPPGSDPTTPTSSPQAPPTAGAVRAAGGVAPAPGYAPGSAVVPLQDLSGQAGFTSNVGPFTSNVSAYPTVAAAPPPVADASPTAPAAAAPLTAAQRGAYNPNFRRNDTNAPGVPRGDGEEAEINAS